MKASIDLLTAHAEAREQNAFIAGAEERYQDEAEDLAAAADHRAAIEVLKAHAEAPDEQPR